MVIKRHSLESFGEQSVSEMADWLEAALHRYCGSDIGIAAFAPLGAGFGRGETTAADIAGAVRLLDADAATRFKRALDEVVAAWPADLRRAWPVLIELVWRLEAARAIEVLAARSTEAFLDSVFGGDSRLFGQVLAFCRQGLPYANVTASELIHSLVEHRLFRNAEARLTLMSLCERDPDSWPLHVSVLRTSLHRQASRIEKDKGIEQKGEFYRGLVRHVGECIGATRLAAALHRLYFSGSEDPDVPSDDWLLDNLGSAFEIELVDDRLYIAPLGNRSNFRAVENFQLHVRDDPSDGDLTDADYALGAARVREAELVD